MPTKPQTSAVSTWMDTTEFICSNKKERIVGLSKIIPFWGLIITGKCTCPSLGPFWNQDHGLITPGSDSNHINVCHIKGFWMISGVFAGWSFHIWFATPIPRIWTDTKRLLRWVPSDLTEETAPSIALNIRRNNREKSLFTPLHSKTCPHRAEHKQTRMPFQFFTWVYPAIC